MSKWVFVLVLGGTVVLGTVAMLKIWPTINIVETGKTPEYPDVVPRQYPTAKGRVFDAVLHAVSRMPRWTLVSSRPEQGEIRVEASTRLFRFVDDVVVRCAEQNGVTVVNVRSASRVGRSDFGQNARNIRAFFDALDSQLGDRAGRT
ncbi:MAG: DUF1499 domain-containing protein [Nitrospiraceae bacterium]|nr:DUF1499 domain-containing protein [Nitrospiraceae bacterium]MSR24605.1 DUF1499 domain-containing protein [Nitrospiraceae bacterium]